MIHAFARKYACCKCHTWVGLRNDIDHLHICYLHVTQAFQLLKLGIGAFLWDFWVWFFDGNCATYIQALPNYTNTINAMPNLGYRCALVVPAPSICLFKAMAPALNHRQCHSSVVLPRHIVA